MPRQRSRSGATRASRIAHHNAILKRAYARADEIEEQMVAVLTPILERAGDEAAAAFELYATDHLTAAQHAQDDTVSVEEFALVGADLGVTSLSTMVCVKPRTGEAAALADPDGEPAENLHVTLVYLGEVDGPLEPIAEALQAVAASHAPLRGVVGGYGEFKVPDGKVGILLPDVPGLVELRVAVTEALVAHQVEYARNHGFEAHITIDVDPEDGEADRMLELAGSSLSFDELMIVRGDTETVSLPFTGSAPLTAAARSLVAAGGRPFCLPAELRTKTDPVRQAVIDSVAKSTLDGAGIVYDVTNPYIDKALAKSASQITNIAQTTQLDVMRVIRASYDEGLTIPDTAKAIQAYMREAAPVRARLIARTELAGAVNGGSLAATQVFADELAAQGGEGEGGAGMFKGWATAPGAPFPRHELYDDLDGQTVPLDEFFDVGGDQLQYPGDPDGSPEEVCNCRCGMVYTDEPPDLTAALSPSRVVGHVGVNARAEIDALEVYLLAAAGPPEWTAPAASEILPIDCGTEASAVERAFTPGGYDVTLLPEYARAAVADLSPAEADAQARRLASLKSSLRQRQKAATGERYTGYQARIDATDQRIAELRARAAGEELPVPTPAPAPEEVALSRYNVALLPEYARGAVAEMSPGQAAAEAKRLKTLRHSLLYRAKNQTPEKASALMERVDATEKRLSELEARAAGAAPSVSAAPASSAWSTQSLVKVFNPSGAPSPRMRKRLEGEASRALGLLDRVFPGGFGQGGDVRLQFKSLSKPGTTGEYTRLGRTINLNTKAVVTIDGQPIDGTLFHEFGHYLDWTRLGEDFSTAPGVEAARGYGSVQAATAPVVNSGQVGNVMDAISRSDAYAKMSDALMNPSPFISSAYYEYLLRPQELFARAFAEYVTTEAAMLPGLSQAEKDALIKVLEETSADATGRTHSAWTPTDFAPIKSALDDLFRSLGWKQ